MKIKEIIKYQWKSKENKTLQQKALKILGYFLVLLSYQDLQILY